MAENMNDMLLHSKYATAICITDATNTQDVDVCELFVFDLDDPAFQENWYTLEDMSNPQTGLSSTHALKKGVNKEHLQKIWRISEDEARCNIEVTTQLNMWDANSNLLRAFSSNDQMLRYNSINSFFFTNTFFGNKSARGYICMQIFVSDKVFFKVYSMKSKAQFPQELRLFTK